MNGDQIRALVPSHDISDDQIASDPKLCNFLQAQGMARGCTCIKAPQEIPPVDVKIFDTRDLNLN